MAEASKQTVTVETYVVTLSKDEAESLRFVCNNVAGCPEKSRRKHTDAINRALRLAGVVAPCFDDHVGRINLDAVPKLA